MFSDRLTRAWPIMLLVLAVSGCAFVRALNPVPTPAAMGAHEAGSLLATLGPPNQVEAQVEEAYRRVAPAVVYITSTADPGSPSGQAQPQQIAGTGFVFDKQGHVVTNYHVVENAGSIAVAMINGAVYTATILATDYLTDMAVLQVYAPNMPAPLVLGDSAQLRVGQFVIAIGNPFGLTHTVTMGIVSALQRVFRSPAGHFIGRAIQTDASINPGSSGGPLLNLDGQVIGVNSQIQSATGADVGISFAIASCCVARVVPELIANGHYPHPWMGISVQSLSPQLAGTLNQAGMAMPVDAGLLVLQVVPGGPAAEAGIRGGGRVVTMEGTDLTLGGDIITAIKGQAMTSEEQFALYLDFETLVGDTVEVTFFRDGKEMKAPVTLGDLSQ